MSLPDWQRTPTFAMEKDGDLAGGVECGVLGGLFSHLPGLFVTPHGTLPSGRGVERRVMHLFAIRKIPATSHLEIGLVAPKP